MIKLIAHDGPCSLLSPRCKHLAAFKLGVRKAAARIFGGDDDGSELDLADVKFYLSPFGVPGSGQHNYDILLEVEVPWSEDLDPVFRERSIFLRTAVRELARQLGYDLQIVVLGRFVREEWITDEVPDSTAVIGQLGLW